MNRALTAAFALHDVEASAAFIFPSPDPDDLLVGMMRAAAGSEIARSLDVRFVVRVGDRPGVAAIGDIDGAGEVRLNELFDRLDEFFRSPPLFVDYRRAELECARLADALAQQLSVAQLDEAIFRAVPRGGHIVLGILALVMGLRPEQLVAADLTSAGSILVHVDDCGLSGHRIRQEIGGGDDRHHVVAWLYATEALRMAVQAHPSVLACVAASQLRDLGDERFGADYPAWQRRWRDRVGEKPFWVGWPEQVAFAWKEPDRSFYNHVTERREASWRVLPGSHCLSSRFSTAHCTVHVQRPLTGVVRPASDIFYVDAIDSVLVLPPGDEVIELHGVAAEMWRAMLSEGTMTGVADAVAARYGMPSLTVRRDVEAFFTSLVEAPALVELGR